MSLATFFAKLIPLDHKTWPVNIEVDGHTIPATAFEENEHGMWHVSFKRPGTYKEYGIKWITPTQEQINAHEKT